MTSLPWRRRVRKRCLAMPLSLSMNAMSGYTHLHGKKSFAAADESRDPDHHRRTCAAEFGTGAVKVTPAHDPNDFEAGRRHNLPQIEVMDQHARMNENAGPYAGLDRYAARKRVLEDLREQGFLVGEKDYAISIGKCDRCGTVVEASGFRRNGSLRFSRWRIAQLKWLKKITSGSRRPTIGRFYLNWMRNIHDWTISRQLWWGHRIPAWHCSCGEIIVARGDADEVSEVRKLGAEAGS